MKHKKNRYSDYRRSSSRERSDGSRHRRSSRGRRDSYSGKDKDEYRSMTRSRSREDNRRKSWRRSRSSRSRSYSSSSSGSSSSSSRSRSRSRSRKGSPRSLRNGSKERSTAKDKNFPPLNLPLGRIGENPQFPSDSNSMQWFDRPPYPRQTPDPPPPPSLGGSVPPPPPAPSFDNQPIPPYTGGPEQRQYPPPNFQDPNFGGNYQENYHEYGSTYYQGVNPSFPSQGPQNQQHNYGMESGPPPPQPNMSGSNWNNMGFSSMPPSHSGMPAAQHPHGFKNAPESSSASHNNRPLTDAYENSKKEAVEQELVQQKRTLAVQREEYFKRKIALTRELNRLKDQKRELLKEDSKENDRILKENSKLQSEIIQKLESMDNVIEMLSNIIGDKAEIAELMKETSFATGSPKKPDKRKRSGSRSPHKKSEKGRSSSPFEKPVNIVHYDPEIHWCSTCDIFPRTVVEYLTHLHADDHKKMMSTKKNVKEADDAPWRINEPREASPPSFKNASSKKVPIRGLQFLVPATAWYCSLCKMWIGDGDVANRHLRGQKHASNYREFISQNPHFEVDWLTERTKAYEKNSDAKLRVKSEKVATKNEPIATKMSAPSLPTPPPPPFDIGNLGDRLLAMIAASSKLTAKDKRRSASESSKSSSNDSDDDGGKKKDKKKKKKKKSQKKEESSKHKEDDLDEKLHKKKKELQKKGMIKDALELEKKEKKWGSSKGKNYEDEEEDGSDEVKPERRGRFGELEWNRPKKVGRWNVEPSDRNYRQSDKSPHGPSRPNSKNVQAGPDFLTKEFHGPAAPGSPKRTLSKTEFYGPKAPPKKDHAKGGDSKEKRSPEHDRKIGKGRMLAPGRNEEESNIETVFEKKTSESAAKKKDVKKMSFAMPKSKLPFIGRMPILKKKVEVKPDAASDKESTQPEMKNSVEHPKIPLELQNKIPDPQILMETNDEPSLSSVDTTLPKSTLIISKRPRLADTELGKKEIVKIKTTDDNLQEQDMEIEDEPHKEESVVKDELVVEDIEVPPAKDELHKDFKDALDLLFPEEKPEGEEEEPVPAVVSESEQVAQSTTSAPPQAYGLMSWPQQHQGMEQHPYPMHYDQAYMQHVPYMTPMGYEHHPGMYAMPPPEYLDPTMSMGQHPAIPQTHEQVPPQMVTPNVPTPGESSQDESKEKDDESKSDESPSPVVKRNAPGQRLRRHLKRKAMMEAEKKKMEEEDKANIKSTGSTMRPELSELAMLGIEEDDITAQNFF